MLADFAFLLCEGALVLSPMVCATDLFKIGRTPPIKRPRIVIAALAFVILGVICAATNWSVRDVPNWIVSVVAYGGFVALATATSRWPSRKGVRYVVLGLTLVVMSVIACVFPITFLEDYTEHGNTRMSAGYRFSAEWFGGAWSQHNGAYLSLYRTYWWLPFMERRVWQERFQDNQCEFARISETWSPDRRALIVNCPGLRHDVVLRAD
jgi:hypothetical protein